MFRLILITIVITVVGASLYLATTNPEMLPGPLQSFAPKLKEIGDSARGTAESVLSKGKDAQPAVMGIQTEASKVFQEDATGKPMHQKALEFTQYEYCKMVVKNYELDQATHATPSATPKPKDE